MLAQGQRGLLGSARAAASNLPVSSRSLRVAFAQRKFTRAAAIFEIFSWSFLFFRVLALANSAASGFALGTFFIWVAPRVPPAPCVRPAPRFPANCSEAVQWHRR